MTSIAFKNFGGKCENNKKKSHTHKKEKQREKPIEFQYDFIAIVDDEYSMGRVITKTFDQTIWLVSSLIILG